MSDIQVGIELNGKRFGIKFTDLDVSGDADDIAEDLTNSIYGLLEARLREMLHELQAEQIPTETDPKVFEKIFGDDKKRFIEG